MGERVVTIREAINEALAHHEAGRLAEARHIYETLLRSAPKLAIALHQMGLLTAGEGDLTTAIRYYSAAIESDPRFVVAYCNLGNALKDNCQLDEAMNAFRTAQALDPNHPSLHRNLLTCLLYLPGLTPEQRFAEHRAFASHYEPPRDGVLPPADNDRDPDRPLRIGMLSSDFQSHPVGRNSLSLFTHRDRNANELICYAEVAGGDNYTELFRNNCDGWRPTIGMSDRAVAEQIRADRIDILVVFAARYDRNRPVIACYRPAPVQVSAFNSATSGLESLDYWMADRVMSPPDTTERFTEEVVYLPLQLNYPPLSRAPDVGPLPAASNGFVTFGGFNNPTKISSDTIAQWSAVLNAIPSSRLALRYRMRFTEPALQARFRAAFGARGVAPERIVFLPGNPELTYLDAYNHVDVTLDTIPFAGVTTTFNSIWMGVPVIALAGDTIVSRTSATLLTGAGLQTMITRSPQEYVALAAGMTKDLDGLAALRGGLRKHVERSPLCDGPAYTRSVERLWRELWHRWCRSAGGA